MSSTILGSMRASRFPCGVRRVGFIRMTRTAGSSGIADTILDAAFPVRTNGRSGAGGRSRDILRKSKSIAAKETPHAIQNNAKPSSTGRTTVGGCRGLGMRNETSFQLQMIEINGVCSC